MIAAAAVAASVAAFSLAGSAVPAETASSPVADSPAVPPQMAESVNEFAFDFYRKLSETDENVFFSPVSIYAAFSVLYEGARGETAGQMLGVFGFEPDDEARHAASANMMAALNAEDPHAVLEMANALWLADWFEPYERYLDISRNTYLATVETVDFAGEGKPGVKKVNDWAAEKTRDEITDVLPRPAVDSSTAAVITNAVYLKGTWLVQFPKEDTREGKFWRGAADSIGADFMHVKNNFGYADTGDAQVLRLPYEGDRLSMLAVLPGGTGGLERLEAEMSAKQMSAYIGMLEPQDVAVSLPKFETKTKYDLKTDLIDLGMPDVFTSSADLGDLSDNDSLYVDRATHDAYVKVNEEGTEAAAVTVIAMRESAPPPLPYFNADRPFLFAIYDEQSGLVLFMGRISDPTA